jgi:G3E family GTPase
MALPTILVSGSLGSGKTTLLKAIVIANPEFRFGIVVNEFGETGVDGDLMRPFVPEIVEIRNGCICCATQDQLAPAITEMLRIYNVDVLLLEMSGVAEPLPVIRELRILAPLVDIRSHTVLIDTTANPDLATRDRGFRNAVVNADVMVLTKVDIADPSVVSQWSSFSHAINARADLLHAANGALDLVALTTPTRGRAHDMTEGTPTFHDAKAHRFTSFCLFLPSVTFRQLNTFVSLHREKVVRIKGIVQVDGAWAEVQAVRGDLRIGPFVGTPPDRGRLVFISNAMYQQELRRVVVESLGEIDDAAFCQFVKVG